MVEGWVSKPLAELAVFYSGGTPNKANPAYWGGSIPWVTVKDMKTPRLHGAIDTLTEQGAETVRVVPSGAVLVLVRGMGLFKDLPVVLCDKPVAFNQDIKALVPKKEVDNQFLAYALFARKGAILKHLETAGHGTGRLDTDLLKSTCVLLPPLPEQRKIAKILRTWDEAIEKLEALRAAKARLLNYKYATIFHPGSSANSGWPERRIGDFVNPRAEKALPSTEMPLYSLTIEDGITPKTERYNRDFLVKDRGAKTYKIVHPGDIVFNPANLRWGAIARSYVSHPVVVSPIYEVLGINSSKIDLDYLNHALTCPYQIRRFATKVEGTLVERMAVKLDTFLMTEILVPNDRKEQVRFSEIFNTMETEIRTLSRQKVLTERQKRGLMQKLLTGEWRVNTADFCHPDLKGRK